MHQKRCCRCPHRGSIETGFGALPRGGAPVPATTIKINREQRDGLFEVTSNHLGSAGSLVDLLERAKDYAKAEQLGLEAGLAGECLLQSLGHLSGR